MRKLTIPNEQEQQLHAIVESRTDAEAARLRRYLAMSDLSRTPGSPIYELAERIIALPDFKDFDVVEVPEITPVSQTFDLFDFPADHPARSKSDTYYVDETNILRTHTTVSWYYYLTSDYAKEKIKNNERVGVLTYGKVYRKDEIDRHHMNVFHQMDGYLLVPKNEKTMGEEDLKDILTKIAQAVFGKEIKFRFNEDKFPYTHPSIEMEVDKDGKWVEVLGAGVVKGSVLEKLGVDSSNYTGWAFGFGLERLAIISMELPDIRLLWSSDDRVKKQLKLGQKFVEVSKYPPIVRDVSFLVSKNFVPNDYFDLIRDIGGDLVEEVALLDKYENAEKFGDKISYTYRITYRSNERTLASDEIDPIQAKVYEQTASVFKAEMR
jgi:phenylalanyl-tRNA synthetase alpha chain